MAEFRLILFVSLEVIHIKGAVEAELNSEQPAEQHQPTMVIYLEGWYSHDNHLYYLSIMEVMAVPNNLTVTK